jgi:tetratricopeptide (TPR) repeat protein
MSPLYPYPKPLPIWVYLSPIAFFAILGLVIWLIVKDRRWWVFGVAFFFFNVVFLLQILGAGQGFLADRFTYVPYFGFFAIFAWLYDRYAQTPIRSGLNIAAGVALVLFAVLSFRQIGIWENGGTLWSHVMKYEKLTNSLPYWNRGQFYRQQGNYDASLKDYSQAIDIEPKNSELYNSRGKTYFDMAMSGKYPAQAQEFAMKAISDYTTGLSQPKIKNKTRSELLINRGAANASQNRYGPAMEDLNAGLGLDPNNKNGYFNRSLVYFMTQQYPKAVEDYSSYLKYDPYNANVWYERGMLRRTLNNSKEAVEDLSRAIQLNPNLSLAYRERARAHAQQGNKAAAQQDYQRAAQYNLQMEQMDITLMNR